jgi:hypothetical protein
MSDDAHSDREHLKQAAETNGSSRNSNPTGRHDHCFCDSLHSVCPILPGAALIRPDFGLADSSVFVFTAPRVVLARPPGLIRRQPPDRQQVLTPEVCLGPAFHSLAPPISRPS